MNESKAAAWERTRARGKRGYVLRNALVYGLGTTLVFFVVMRLMFGPEFAYTPVSALVYAVMFTLVGAWQSARTWKLSEGLYAERERLNAEEAAAGL